MNNNPLFSQLNDDTGRTNAPTTTDDAAVQLIRQKVARAYEAEPNAAQELTEAASIATPSKHQRYMQELSSSGKSLADVQTAWHHYYVTLSDAEKHEVWQEFYAANQHTPYQKMFQKQYPGSTRRVIEPLPSTSHHASLITTLARPAGPVEPVAMQPVVSTMPPGAVPTAKPGSARRARLSSSTSGTTYRLKQKIVGRVNAGGKLSAKHHVQSLLFGLGTGALVLVILLFSFFNQYVIAPFIQPSRTVSATPIILGSSTASSTSPEVVIPKINVQIPLIFDLQSNDESVIESGLENGVVHYPSTVTPGQTGNAAFFGHSSNNIFNPGKYKFAFVLLHTLTTGDVFYISYNGTTYAYQVFAREVVPPSQVGVLTDTKGKTATATLITCDPPGTSNNRLVVWGEQISPDPAGNAVGQATVAASQTPTQLASNGPSLWSRMVGWVEFWN